MHDVAGRKAGFVGEKKRAGVCDHVALLAVAELADIEK